MKSQPSPFVSVWLPLMLALAVLLLIIGLMRPANEAGPAAKEISGAAAPARADGGRTIMQRARERSTAVDVREAGGGEKSSAGRAGALEELRREIPGVQVEFDAITGAPKHIMVAGRFLAAAGTGAADPHAPVRAFVERHAALFGHDAAELARGRARVTREDVTAHNGMRTVVWQQEVAGVGVFESILRANLTKSGDLITLGSHFMADAPKAAEKQIALVSNPSLNAPRALAAAAASLGGALDAAKVTTQPTRQGAEQAQKLEAPGFTDTTAHLAWVPLDESTLRLAWQIETFSLQHNEMFRMLVDAEDGKLLVRQSLTTDISNATYRVYAKPGFQPYDSPAPFSPGHLTPSSAQPAEVSRNAVTLDAVNTTASPNGWIDDGGTQTLGNNVDAHTDTNADNAADLPRPTSATRNFDFALDLTQAPSTYRDAAVTNLFYLCNFIHDQYYSLGFTESSGNFQTNNFGRGGNGNDAVQADAQDGSGTNNANFSTPSDGSPGRMQMYVFTGPTPDRDGDFDHEIVIHEYTHGLSNRLVGGGVGMSQNQSQGMGEGWSDFYGLCLLSEAGDDPNGNYAAGGYATKDFSGLTQNYYFGIRRYPYSTDMSKNPLTFRDIDPAQASSHTGIARSPIIGSTANEVHNEGEVWCVTLWDMRANLIAKHGWATGNQLALQITTDAMKLCPANPNMLQSRDAIVQADLVGNAGANRNEIWAAFAKRGMGASATSPASSTTSGLVESFDVPDNLGVSPAGALAATGLIGGPFTPASRVFTLQNSGAAALNWTASVNQPWLSLTGAAGALAAGASTTVTASFNAAANALVAGSYAATVTFTNTTSGAVITRGVSLTVDPQRITIFSEPFDAATLGSSWTVTGTSTYRTQVTALNGPRASNHLTMDSSVDASYARNEATLTVNLAGRSDVELSFWAKSFNDEANGPPASPFTNGADFDGVAVSADGGTTWWEVQPLRSLTSVWTKYTVDLDAAIAARGISYNANFKIRFNQYDNYTITTDGIAIDDILVAQTLNNNLALALPASAVTEGASDLTATLTVSPAQAAALTVNLAASRADVTVPASVVVPAGATQATFPVTIVDDALLDGSQVVTITATAPTFSNGSAMLAVDDNEMAVLTLDAPLNGNEGSSPIAATVSVGAAVDVDVTVRLDTSNPQASIPPSVTIPAGQSSAEFYITLVNDGLINGTRSATLTASVTGWTAGTDTISILDDETSTVALVLNDTTSEGLTGTPQIGTLTLGGTAVTPVEVTLISSDTSELTVPATITIAAGQNSAALPATVIDDADLDGTQTVTVSAAAFGNAAVTDTIDVRDNDAASFVIGAVASPQREMQTFPLTITARDVNGALVPSVAGPWTLSAAGDGGAAVLNAPAAAFVNGVWQQNVSIAAPDTNVRVTITGPNATAQSNAFDVTIGPRIAVAPASFTLDIPRQSSKTRTLTITNNGLGVMTWSAAATQSWLTCAPASGSVAQGQSATVTLTFNAATLAEGSATAQLNVTSNDPITPAVAVPVTLNVTAPVASFAWDTVPSPQRANAPFPVTVTAKDAGGATVTNFEGTVALTGGIGGTGVSRTLLNSPTYTNTLNNGTYTAGYSFTPASAIIVNALRSFSGTKISIWTDTGTLLASVPVTAAPGGTWSETPLPTPLPLQAGVTYRLGFLTGGVPYYWRTDMSSSFPDGTIGAHYEIPGDAFPANTYSGQKWMFVDLSYSVGTPVAIAPVMSSAFSSGVWSGNVSVLQTANSMALFANDGAGHTGASNTFDANADGTLGITLASQVSESAGTLGGTVTITPAPAADVVVTLSSSVAGAAVPAAATVTVPAGSTSVPFTLNITDDALLDGPQTTQIGAVGAGYVAVSAPLVVADDEAATLTINLAQSSYAEGAGVISGTITSDNAPVVPVTIALTSSDTTEATVPASVTLAAGATSAAFSMTIINDTLVDGDQSLVLTAAVAGWTSGTKNLTVTDNEARTLTLTGVPASISEGAATLATPTVALTGQAVAPVVVTLTSSDVTALPSISVTIPAGASSAVFDLDPVDDVLFDGTQSVMLTASAATFSDGTANVAVLDDDVHHFALSAVPSPQKEGAGFAFTATAKDINDVTIAAPVGGPVNLSAAGDGGALSVLPAVLTPFTAGVWTGQVRVMAPDTNVRLTVTSPTASNQSNAFDVGMGPRLGVNPASYALSVAQGTTKTRSLTLNNTGVEPLNWSAATTGDIDPALESVLASLTARYAEVTALIPSRYDFFEGETGTNISDGGGDMYDGGNYIAANAGTALNYSNNVIASSTSLGTGGRYFTSKQPGLFVFAADVASISSFDITGYLGADGGGSLNGTVLTATRGSHTFKGFVKRVFAAGDPSVNHLVILEDNGSAAHSFPSDTNNDQHSVTGLAGVTRLYYLLYSSQSGGLVDDTATLAVFNKFLDVIGKGSWMTVTPASGTVAAGGSQSVSVAFSAGSLNTGVYNGGVSITSNDALTSPLAIPATMTVTPGIHHFEWDVLPTPQVVNTPVTATIRARDAADALVTDFEGTAALTALNTAAAGEAFTGSGSSSTWFIHDTSYPVHRTQCIYTPAEAGPAARLSGLAFDVATLGSPAASNFTIRLKHTARANYSTDASWEASGWTTVFTGSKTLAAGLNYFTFSAPFDYDGTSNLMVDISFVNGTYVSASNCRYTTASASRMIYYGSYSGDPLQWSGTSTYAYTSTALPNLRLVKSGAPAFVSPVATGAFVGGVWTGDIRLGTAGTIEVTATAADGAKGTSNAVTTTSTGMLALTIPASTTEGDGTLTSAGTVTVSSAPAAPLTVYLESLDTSELTLPASVTVPAGQTSVIFDVSVVDDTLLDGPMVVQARALAVGYPTVAATSIVSDNDTTTVTLTLPASMTEGGTAAQGTVQLGATAAANLTVTLSSSIASRLAVPASVVIPAGQTSATFTITAPNNSIVDGDAPATITATLAGSAPASGVVQVIDNESRTITVYSSYSSISEGSAPLTSAGYVYLSGTTPTALTITLASSDTTELTAPATVTIPAGSSQSAYFTLTPVNDSLQDGSQSVTLTASAPTFSNGTRSFTILDDELHHFTVSTVASPQVKNGPFNATFTAKDINDVTIAAYAGTPALTAADGVTPLTVTPASLTGFSSGAITQSVTVGAFATSAVLTLTDAVTGGSGSSNAFAVGAGSLHHFTWDAVPSPQSAATPFNAGISARDAYENAVPSFAGPAQLNAVKNYNTTTGGTGTDTDWYPFGGYYPQNRCQMIYTPAEAGGVARKLQALAFDMTTPNASYPAVTLTNFTIRLKHTTKTDYSTSAVWETAGWTTVYQGTVNMNQTGWRQINFTTPFDYNGVDRLMVDISSSQAGYVNRIEAKGTYVYPYRVLYNFTSSATPPTQWTGAASSYFYLPNLRLVSFDPVTVTPPQTTAFTAGAWNGAISIGTQGSINVVATDAATGVSGISNTFTVASLGTLGLSLPTSSAGEADGSVTATLSTASAQAADLAVNIASSNSAAATVPTSVTIPAGQTGVTFPVSIIDDSDLDGTQVAIITASVQGFDVGVSTLNIIDDETTTLTLTLPPTMTEGTGSSTGQASVQIASVAGANLTVQLASSLPAFLTAPASVVIPAGQTSASFTLTAPNNSTVDPTQNVTITATLAGSPPASGTVQVADNESHVITLSLSYSSVSEGGAPLTSAGYAYLSGAVSSPVTVSLTSNDTTELTVPASVTIPAGSSSSAYFTLTPVNDTLQDGSQTVTLTASAAGFTNGTRTITVLDDDVHHFTVSTVASPQVMNGPFNVTFTAKDINNVTISAYAGTPALTAADGVTPLAVTPASLSGFSSGVKAQSVTVGAFATSAVLTLTDAVTGGSGSSNAFAVGAGAVDHFTWGAVASPQMLNAAFGATLFARDIYENTVTSFSGTANLSATGGYSMTTAGAGTSTTSYPYGGYYPQNRCQMIYTPAEAGGTARRLQALAFDMTSSTSVTLANFTIRLKHTSKTSYAPTGAAVWESTDWTTVYAGTVTMNQTGWRQIDFTTPFDYNGTDHLMVDISNSNTTYASFINARYSTVASRVLAVGSSGNPLPTLWTGTTPSPSVPSFLPNLRLISFQNVPMLPAQATVFAAGAWNGQVTVQAAASGVRLRASNPANGVATNSNPFDVSYYGDLSVTLPATVVESAGSISGTVSVSAAPSSDLTVSLASSDATELLPAAASVVIPAGQTSAPFTLTVLDDADLDGGQIVQITATGPDYQTGSATVTVGDNETTTITLTAPASVSENQGTLPNAGTITLGTAVTSPVTVLLSSSDTTELTVPASVVIPAGASSVSFSITAVNDTIIDLDQAVTLTASVAGWTAGAAPVTVTDDEPRNLTFVFASSATEGDAALPATVSAGRVMGYDLAVSLSSSKTGEATVPATVVIPAGQQTASFTISIIDDAAADGAQTTSITAAAPVFNSGTRGLTVRDNEPHHLDISTIASPQTRNTASPVTVRVMTIDGALVANFASTASLAVTSTGGVLGVTPPVTGAFAGGVWTGDVTISDVGTGAVLTATIAGGVTGSSNAFDVRPHGALAGFEWSPVPPTQYRGVPVPVTITARDAAGNVVTDFNQTVNLTAPIGASGTRNVGSATTSDVAPIHTGFHDCRAQEIYLPGEVGGAGHFTSLALNMTTAPPSVNLTGWTIRMKHTSRTQFGPAASDYIWETEGWTTVFSGSVALSGFAGWIKFDFSTPFDYNGTDNLLIDFSFDNSSKFSPTTFTYVAATTRTAGRRISYYSDSGHGAPLSWSGASPVAFADSRVADLRLESNLAMPMTPSQSGAFVNGVWSGSLTFSGTAAGVTVIASYQASDIKGASSAFSVIDPPPAARLAFTAQPGRAADGQPFPVTISALDAAGNVAPAHTAPAALSLVNPENVTTTIGTGLLSGTVPLYTAQTDCRSQIVYKRAELGPARRLTGLALNVSTASAFSYTNFTLRLKHTSLAHFNTAPSWEGAGWTVVWQGAKTFDTTGWILFTFATPFDYNGTDNLMLDVSFDNTSSGTGAWLRKDPTGYDVGMTYYYSPSHGDPLTWSGASVPILAAVERPQIRLLSDPGVTLSPASTGAFVNGVWSGSLTVTGMHPSVVIKAQAAGLAGISQPVMVGFPAPAMVPEPAFTGGTANLLSWSPVSGPASYTLQRDTTLSFSSPVSIPAIGGTSATATGLQDGLQYYYRVCGDAPTSHPAASNEWRQTAYADFAACTHSGTSASLSLHDVALAASSTTPTTWTENFNGGGSVWAGTIFSQAGGTAAMDLQAMSAGPATTPELPVNTGGDMEGRIGNASGFGSSYALMPSNRFADGAIEGYLAPENAAAGGGGMGSLILRGGLSAANGIQGYAGYAVFSTSTAYFGIYVVLNGVTTTLGSTGFSTALTTSDNLKMRLSAQGNTLTLQAWKVSISGGVVTETPITLESGSTSLVRTDTTFASGSAGVFANGTSVRCYFDDIAVTSNAPVFVSSGAVTSPAIVPSYFKTWGNLNFTSDASESGTSLSVDVLDSAGALLAANVASGTNLNSLPAVAAQPAIKLRANLATSVGSNSPYLRDWTVGYMLNASAPVSSVWSDVVSSVQDATPPVVSVPALHTSADAATLAGTAVDSTSGVASVLVAGSPAVSSDGFAAWTRTVSALANGPNSFNVTASDNAVPPNTTSVTATVFRIAAPTADSNGDGISDLLSHALGFPAAPADPGAMLPATSVQTDAGSGQRFLTLDYRRRIQRAGLAYKVETSSDLSTWTATGGDVVEESVTPVGDGTTETVRVRVTPSIDLGGSKFVRLNVTVQ